MSRPMAKRPASIGGLQLKNTNLGVVAGVLIGQKAIADGAATALFDVACPVGGSCGGVLHAVVQAADGADLQAMAVIVTYAAVNKAGTLTLTITDLATVDAKAVSAGTLTLAWSLVTGAGKCTVKVTPTGSLTETLFTVTFVAMPVVGLVTLL